MSWAEGAPSLDSEDDEQPFGFVARVKKQATSTGPHVHSAGGACCAPPRLLPTPARCQPVEESAKVAADPARKFACDQPGCKYKAKHAGNLKKHKAHVHDIGVAWHFCDQPGCEYKAKHAGHLNQHKAYVHDIGVAWHFCDQPGCEYKAKRAATLHQHKAYVHDIGVAWHFCDQPGCEYKAKRAGHLKRHKANAHDIGVVWHFCDQPGCEYKAKDVGSLQKHKANVHAIDVVWRFCDQPGCEYKAKQSGNMKDHKANAHDIDVAWHFCDQPGCEYKTKRTVNLKRHKANAHDIGVVWHFCDQPGCEYKAKDVGDLQKHKANVHAIDVVWRFCDQPGCEYKTKRTVNLKRHKAIAHDIGVVWHFCDQPGCEYKTKRACTLLRHVSTQHNDVYVARQKKQEERVRSALLDGGFVEYFATANIPPVGYFKREKRIDFRCADVQSSTAYARIDFVVSTSGGIVFLEVDEGQHLYGYDALVSCDMKRMSHVMESLAVELGDALPSIYWLRYNPDAYHVDGDLVRVPKADREQRLLDWLRAFESSSPLGIGYAFYDTEDGALCVLDNESYSPHLAEVVDDLGQLL